MTTANIKEYDASDSIGRRLLEVQRLTIEIDALKNTLEAEKAYLLNHVNRINRSGLRCGAVLASKRTTTTWVYSEAVKAAEKRVKDLKAKEQEKGTAKSRQAESLVVTISGKVAAAQVAATVATLDTLLERTPSQPHNLVEVG